MGFILGVLMALSLVSVAPDFRTRRINRQNEINVSIENDETVDTSPSSIPIPFNYIPNLPGDVKVRISAKLGPYVSIIEDEFGERRVISRINWSNKLRSEVIDFLLRYKNSELEKKVEGTADPLRHRRDVSGMKEEKEKPREKEEMEKDKTTTLDSSVDPKVLNNETRPKDQEQMIRIELPAGVHTGQNTKLLHTNDTGFVNLLGGNLAPNKALENKENRDKPRPRFYQDEQGDPEAHTGERHRDADEPSTKNRIELKKITLQFKHLSEFQKSKFCSYLRRDSMKEPLQMLMALLGKVYSESSEKSADHWDEMRGTKLGKTQDGKARQKLILKWACEDWRQGRDLVNGDALRSMGISRSLRDDGEFDPWRKVEFPFGKPRDPLLEVRLTSFRRHVVFKETLPTGIPTNDRQPDGFVFSLKLGGDNRVTKQVRVIIDMDEDTRDYHN